MSTIQERVNKTGTSYRVGYRQDGKFKWTPSLKNRAGAEKIAGIIDRQGPAVALRILKVAEQSKTMTLAEWFVKHVERKAALKEITDGTAKGYEDDAARTWLPRLGDFPLDTIDREAVIEWVVWQSQQPTHRSVTRREKAITAGMKPRDLPPLENVAPKTVRNAHALLSSVLDTAADEGYIARNPAKGVPVPKDDVEEEKEIFTLDEWTAFYEAMEDHYKPFVAHLLVTGARISEATACQVHDVNPRARTVSILRAWKKGRAGQVPGVPKSRRSRRVVVVDQSVIDMLLPLMEGKAPDDLLFTAERGGRIHGHVFLERQWARAMKKAGLGKHLTPHSLRHTFASWQLMAGVPPQVVQHRLGHESLSTTSQVYAHLLTDAQTAGVEAIGWTPPAMGELEV